MAGQESCLKSQFINGLTGELHHLLAKEDTILDKPITYIVQRMQSVDPEMSVPLIVSAVNSCDSFIPVAFQE